MNSTCIFKADLHRKLTSNAIERTSAFLFGIDEMHAEMKKKEVEEREDQKRREAEDVAKKRAAEAAKKRREDRMRRKIYEITEVPLRRAHKAKLVLLLTAEVLTGKKLVRYEPVTKKKTRKNEPMNGYTNLDIQATYEVGKLREAYGIWSLRDLRSAVGRDLQRARESGDQMAIEHYTWTYRCVCRAQAIEEGRIKIGRIQEPQRQKSGLDAAIWDAASRRSERPRDLDRLTTGYTVHIEKL